MPQTTQIERAGADQIERAYAGANYANSANSADFAPSFADLLATGERELIREPLREWLAKGDRAGATYVYEAWLKAGGEPELIRESLRKWLADSATAPGNTAPGNATAPDNATAERASFVYTAWLKVTGEVELVREALGAWFELHGEFPAAGYVYCAWLSAGGEVQAFSERICDWLAAHTNDQGEAHNLYSMWLQRGGEPALVAPSLERWLAAHEQDETAGPVCASWLKAGGEPLLIAEPAARWLSAYARIERACFLYTAWLQRGGEREPPQSADRALVLGSRRQPRRELRVRGVAESRRRASVRQRADPWLAGRSRDRPTCALRV